ncbi:MAG: hypothetical protein AAGG48_07330 [Planctomycetota bacterium]
MRFQYSLRTLVWLTVIAAIATLGLHHWMSRTTVEDIVEALNLAGAQPRVLDHWNGDAFFEQRVEVAHLSDESSCVGLRFDQIRSRDTLLAASYVKTATDLRILDIAADVSVRGCDFTHLTDLHLGGITRQQLVDWLSTTGKLEDLSLADLDPMELDLSVIGNNPSLKYFRISKATITPEDLLSLSQLPNLEHISFYSCHVSDQAFAVLADFPKLDSLEFYGDTYDDHTVEYLKHLTSIRSLDLTHSKVTDHGVKILSGMNHLESLSLYGCEQITSECVPHLIRMQFLEWLDVLGSTIERDETLLNNSPATLTEWIM